MPQKNRNSEDSAFKNWINKDLVLRISAHIQKHSSQFDFKSFEKVGGKLQELEMKPRVQLIREALHKSLPTNYNKTLSILLKATLSPHKNTKPLKGFDLWPFTDFVQTYGLSNLDESLQALAEFTKLFTAEFAVRPFLIHHPKETLSYFHQWMKSENVHLRRLASEGSRPRLPWGEQLKAFIKDPSPTLPILEALKYDEELYVRKSVANHLNDISKDHPELAIKISKKWLKECPPEHKAKINWIVRHGLRTLIKKGNKSALELLGYSATGKVEVKDLKISTKKVRIGDHLEFSFDLHTAKGMAVMVDYIIHHKKSNGSHSPKVFKLTSKELEKKSVTAIRKKHSFKIVTTRTYYPGTHHLEIMVNGEVRARISFTLQK